MSAKERVATHPRTTLREVRRIARTDQVRAQLERAIREGEFGPGDRLPAERELVEMLGVSRVSVREAIRSREAVGLVTVEHGRGCFVTAAIGDGYSTSFNRWLRVHAEEILELLQVRGALDELAAESAAERADRGMLRALRAAHQRFETALGDPGAKVDQRVRLDVGFHDAIAEAAGSPLLADLLSALHEYMADSRRITLDPDRTATRSASEHGAIVEGIEAGDPRRARAAAARHVASVRRAVLEALSTREE
ncbi:MAG: FadR/GntR family transcriptional regulator [Gaiellaceae bacterium]